MLTPDPDPWPAIGGITDGVSEVLDREVERVAWGFGDPTDQRTRILMHCGRHP